jgi:ATP-binding cassette subfamily A (ABC1) protein 3
MVLLKKLYLVVWKNLIIRRRHWILTLIEIVIPVLLFIVVAAVRSNTVSSDDELHPKQYFESLTDTEIISETYLSLSNSYSLMYAPNSVPATVIMAGVAKTMKTLRK